MEDPCEFDQNPGGTRVSANILRNLHLALDSDGSDPSRMMETPHGMLMVTADMNRKPNAVSER